MAICVTRFQYSVEFSSLHWCNTWEQHILIKPPPNSGFFYFNYKQSFNIVLLAVVDANYKFLYVDIGCNGLVSDGGIFRNSAFSEALENNSLNIPNPEPVPGERFPLFYVIVADDAFPLKENILKPYNQTGLTTEGHIYNYRISRAGCIVEHAFGVLFNRFQIFMSPIGLKPEKVETNVLVCCSLHNYLSSRPTSRAIYLPQGTLDTDDSNTHVGSPGDWRQQPPPQGLLPLAQQGGNRHTNAAKEIIGYLCTYYNSDQGSVASQNNMI